MKAEELQPIIDGLQCQIESLRGLAGVEVRDSAAAPLARQFCDMSDDGQAQFFVEVAAIMKAWGPGSADHQAYFIGRHLATCDCSTSAGRELVRNIAASVRANENPGSM